MSNTTQRIEYLILEKQKRIETIEKLQQLVQKSLAESNETVLESQNLVKIITTKEMSLSEVVNLQEMKTLAEEIDMCTSRLETVREKMSILKGSFDSTINILERNQNKLEEINTELQDLQSV
jgi:chromosome segregation ATPase